MKIDAETLKKQVILHLPYVLFLLVFAKLGEAVRLAPGADASQKLLGLSEGFALAFQSMWPGAAMDWLIGLCGAAIMRLAVYLRGKDAKKYRKNVEYGSARWGNKADIAPFMDPKPENNIILTQSEGLMLNGRPKNPANARNKNVLVVGGSGSGKTRFFIKPNLMQMHSSYVVTDPKGTVLVECGKMLQRGTPKLDKDGKPVRNEKGKIIYEPYKIRVFNTINFQKSMHFNPYRLCERADDVYGGRLPIHVRCLIDEAANIGQIPNLERLMATIRSREISACLVLQAQSQLKALYKDNMDTIIGNCDASLFLGGKEETTLKSWNSLLGKETIDLYNTSVTKGNQESHGQNFQKLGKDLMSVDELAVMDGGKCLLQIRGVRPFLSRKYDITKHPNYKLLSDFNEKNAFNIEKFLSTRMPMRPGERYRNYEVTAEDLASLTL